jgi:predicted secreted protein
MRLVLMSLAASLAVATPAMAQSTVKDSGVRLDVHGGLGWHDGQSVQGTIGATIGYDINTPTAPSSASSSRSTSC